jgi:hypothetical protein
MPVQLRDMNLMTVTLLQAMPIETEKFPQEGMFWPVYDHVRKAFTQQKLLPTHSGNFVTAGNAKLAKKKTAGSGLHS